MQATPIVQAAGSLANSLPGGCYRVNSGYYCKGPNLEMLSLLVLTFLGKSYWPRNTLLE